MKGRLKRPGIRRAQPVGRPSAAAGPSAPAIDSPPPGWGNPRCGLSIADALDPARMPGRCVRTLYSDPVSDALQLFTSSCEAFDQALARLLFFDHRQPVLAARDEIRELAKHVDVHLFGVRQDAVARLAEIALHKCEIVDEP